MPKRGRAHLARLANMKKARKTPVVEAAVEEDDADASDSDDSNEPPWLGLVRGFEEERRNALLRQLVSKDAYTVDELATEQRPRPQTELIRNGGTHTRGGELAVVPVPVSVAQPALPTTLPRRQKIGQQSRTTQNRKRDLLAGAAKHSQSIALAFAKGAKPADAEQLREQEGRRITEEEEERSNGGVSTAAVAILDQVLDNLKDNTPFVAVRAAALKAFFHCTSGCGPTTLSKGAAYDVLAASLNKCQRTAERLVKNFVSHMAVLGDMRGQHRKRLCVATHEGVLEAVTLFCRVNQNITVAMVQKHVNEDVLTVLFPGVVVTVGRETTRVILRTAGFKYKRTSKNVFVDGHERDDVVLYRNKYLARMNEREKRFDVDTWSGWENTLNRVRVGWRERWSHRSRRILVPMYHDETTTYANDPNALEWVQADGTRCGGKKQRKGLGMSCMVSGYACPCHPHLLSAGPPPARNPAGARKPLYTKVPRAKKLSSAEEDELTCVRDRQEAGIVDKIVRLGYFWDTSASVCVESGTAGGRAPLWFNGADLCRQQRKACKIFDQSHPGCDALWIFDNASGHTSFSDDALLVRNMNKGPSDKKGTKMRAGWYVDEDTGEKETQTLVRSGKNIGIEQCLRERGKWSKFWNVRCNRNNGHGGCPPESDQPNHDCCGSTFLAHQPDFLAQKTALEEVVDKHNEESGTHHEVDFLPKFHCELNPIERVWAALKFHLRRVCPGSAAKLRECLPSALHTAVPPTSWGRYFRACFRVMSAYRLGCSYPLAKFASKKYKSHRAIPSSQTLDDILKSLEEESPELFKRIGASAGKVELTEGKEGPHPTTTTPHHTRTTHTSTHTSTHTH
jgi:hypothetical protein